MAKILYHPYLRPLLATAITLSTACAEDLEPGGGDETPGATATPLLSAIEEIEIQGDLTLTMVDATDEKVWIYLDLDTGEEVFPENPADDVVWDLAFQRYHIAINGGSGGVGGVEVAVLNETQIEEVDTPPDTEYLVDEIGEDELPLRVFDGWYAYNPADHTLSPYDIVYVIKGSDGDYYKFQMDSYYDEAGTSGLPHFWWAAL